MTLTPVESSFIESVGHDPDARALYVRTASGRTYRYKGVGGEVFTQLMDAESKGTFFNEHIKNGYEFDPVVWNGVSWEVVR